MPSKVDELEDCIIDTSKYSYTKMLTNKRILFANLALFVSIFQYTFVEPLLTNWMHVDFDRGEKSASLLFFIMGVGYAGTCQGVYLTLKHFSFRRCFYIFFVLNGLCTIMFEPTEIIPIPKSFVVVSVFMFFGGVTSAHTMIPTLPEILDAGKKELHYPVEILNDLSSGLFNMFFAFGEILGPLIGNELYVKVGMVRTCEYIGTGIILFALLYCLVCDDSMPWNKRIRQKVLSEEYFLEDEQTSRRNMKI